MSGRRHARGIALITALILLLIVSILAAASVRMVITSMRVAGNTQLGVEAQHRSQSLIDAVLSIPANTAVVGLVGDTNCLPGIGACVRSELVLPEIGADADLSDSGIAVTVRRLAPEQTPPPRFAHYSAIRFSAAAMQIESRYSGDDGARADLNEGVAVILPMMGN